MKVEAAMRNILRILALVSFAAMLACASGSARKPDKGGGFRVLDAVVVEREAQTGYGGTMVYYMGFEARDGEATSHMRYQVTRDQYFRYQEGAHVRLYLADDRLRDIKSGD
jgi:hypothetical protein